MSTEIALQRTVSDMVAEYEEKAAALAGEIEDFRAATRKMRTATGVGGVFGGDIWWRGAPDVNERAAAKALLTSGWQAIWHRLDLDRVAPAKDKAAFEASIADPPPLTAETACATFGRYLLNPRFHLLRGLAEAFCDLDPAYKSHSKVKVGVAGLPKRIIMAGVGSQGSWGAKRLENVIRAYCAFRGEPLLSYEDMKPLFAMGIHQRAGEVVIRGLRVKRFHNGNGHIIFTPEQCREINLALAEFYGDVLPDVEGDEPGKPAASTAVSKDLQFYPTPAPVIEKLLYEASIEKVDRWLRADPLKVLEPSCGDGRIMDAIRDLGHHPLGIEVHAGRAAEARRKNHAVVTANFLEHPPTTTFDRVVMNPPFYGRHWLHHIRHALRFLKPGGVLVSVLPATAWYDADDLKIMGGHWTDLPIASFHDSGTNVPTGIATMRAPR